MNFKPTLWKSIVSFLFGVLVNYLFFTSTKIVCQCIEGTACKCPKITWIDSAFSIGTIIVSLIAMALAYSIWSFIQKK
jgi:hypothetical protein